MFPSKKIFYFSFADYNLAADSAAEITETTSGAFPLETGKHKLFNSLKYELLQISEI